MECYLPSNDRVHTGTFYHAYRFTPRLLSARKTLTLHYSATKIFFAVVTSLIIMSGSYFLCRFSRIDSFLFLIGAVGLAFGVLWIMQAVFRFLRIYLSDLQGKWVKIEHHKLAPNYIGENEHELFYMDFFSNPDKEYVSILLPEEITSEQKELVEKSSFYKRAVRYTRSIRYNGFAQKEKMIFLAAVSEIIRDKLNSSDTDFFTSEYPFFM